MPASSGSSLSESVSTWWNETLEFWEAVEVTKEGVPLQNDTAAEAIAFRRQLDALNSTMITGRERQRMGFSDRNLSAELGTLLEPMPGLLAAYYRVRLARIFEKPKVKKGFANVAVYGNLAILATFLRVVLPRLVAVESFNDVSEISSEFGLPDKAALVGWLEAVQAYDLWTKIGLFTLVFVVEKLFLLSDILPIQIALKTVSPMIFGGLVIGALSAGICETAAALINFSIGRAFLTDTVKSFSAFGMPPIGEASWFAALQRAARDDGFRLVLLLRLSPLLPIPFDANWYILGALPTNIVAFAAGHFIACLKTCFLDAALGELLLSSVSPRADELQSQTQTILIGESLALGLVALLVSTVASRVLSDLLGIEDEQKEKAPETASTTIKEKELTETPARRAD